VAALLIALTLALNSAVLGDDSNVDPLVASLELELEFGFVLDGKRRRRSADDNFLALNAGDG